VAAAAAAAAAAVAAAAAAVVVVAAVAMVGDRVPGRAPSVGYVPGRDFTGSQPEGRKPSGEVPSKIVITQQYRERHNMTYELDCAGVAFVLRVFFPAEAGPVEWRMEARGKGAGEAIVIDKVAATRELAFQAIRGAWPGTSLPTSTPSYDWDSVTQVLRSVRAI